MQRKRPHDTLGAFGGVARASELYPDWRIGYAPAYPALGSTVKDGALYVDGVAVEHRAFCAGSSQSDSRWRGSSGSICVALPCF